MNLTIYVFTSLSSLSLSLQLSIRTWSWSIDHGCGRQHRITLGSLVRIVQNLWKTPELWLWCQCQQFNWGNTYVRLLEIILYIFQKTHEIDFNNEKILELWFFSREIDFTKFKEKLWHCRITMSNVILFTY